jgi:hypothetical protein
MKNYYFSLLCIISILILTSISFSQSFNASGVPLSLGSSTTFNQSACGSNASISFTVSGVGVITSTNQLVDIDLRLKTPGSIGRLSVDCYLKSPSGTCVKIASKMGDVATSTGINKILDYKFRAPQPCLNKYPDYEATNTPMRYFEIGADGRTGVFATVDDISTAFLGENANGVWKMYFGRNTNTSYTSLPSVQSAKLIFGQPIPVNPPDPNEGVSCIDAIDWDGSPLCATTAGKTSTSNRPSTTGCQWLSTSENNLWIAFTPTDPNVCINISGISEVGQTIGVQSIVVQPTNASNPCAGTWNVINCPRDNVYSSNVGSYMSHNHCFTATPGETYYFVIDGNAGAISNLYITGIEGMPVILAVELISFHAQCVENGVELNWKTLSEKNNDYFIIDYSNDGKNWREIGRKNGRGNTKSLNDYSHLIDSYISKGYFRLSQVNYDGEKNILKTIAFTNCLNNAELSIIPNPSKGTVYLLDIDKFDVKSIIVSDNMGNLVYSKDEINEKDIVMDLTNLKQGIYIATIFQENGSKIVKKIVIE